MLRVLSLFSGIGAFEKALTNLNIDHEVVAYCEIDKYASKAYSVIHNIPEEKNLHDVTKVDWLDVDDEVDLITYGFPCQDISNAGNQKGFTDENGKRTRSGLFFEALRIIEDFRPKFAIAENVRALTSKKFSNEFKTVLDSLDEVGYNNYWQVLNSKNYGVPQNRERVFIISIRKDIDKGFTFPEPVPLELRLKDLLESSVDESFYLKEATLNFFKKNSEIQKEKGNGFRFSPTNGDGIAKTITTRAGSRMDDNFLTITNENVRVREAVKKGYSEAYPGDTVNVNYVNSKTRRGRVGKNGIANTLTCHDEQAVVEVDEKYYLSDKMKQYISKSGTKNFKNCDNKINLDIARPLTTDSNKRAGTTNYISQDVGSEFNLNEENVKPLRMRKLTPVECYRLMGFTAEDCLKASAEGISNTQLYKQAGNSIVVDVLEAIYTSLGNNYDEFKRVG